MKSKLLVLFTVIVFSTQIYSQHIDAKLGENGIFTVKSNNDVPIFQVTGSEGTMNFTGSIFLPPTTDYSTGVVFKGPNRFLHDKGVNNLFLGLGSGNFTMSGAANGNIGVGTFTLQELTMGIENSAFGNVALQNNSEGNYNSAFGSFSMQPNTTGYMNSAFGYSSLRSNTEGYNNSAFGVGALFANATGHDNSAFGISSLNSNITGFFNSAFGMNALRNNTAGDENSAFGQAALFANTNGYSNSAFGTGALQGNTSGFYNTAIGYNAGNSVTTGSNLTLIGFGSQPSSPSAVNQITLGNGLVTSIRANVTSISSLSDARDKKNIKELSLGLDFLMKVKTREFNWDKREWYEDGIASGSKMEEQPTAGFIAQELDNLQSEVNAGWLNLVLKENPERLEASAGNLLPVIVKAVQDLKIEKDSEIAQLKSDNALLKKELESLKEIQIRLVKLEQVLMNSDLKYTSNYND